MRLTPIARPAPNKGTDNTHTHTFKLVVRGTGGGEEARPFFLPLLLGKRSGAHLCEALGLGHPHVIRLDAFGEKGEGRDGMGVQPISSIGNTQ